MSDTWNLTPLFSSDTDPEIEKNLQDTKEASYKFINKWKDRSDYLENPTILKEALDEYESWAKNFGVSGHAGYYFGLRLSQDQANSALKARDNQITESSLQIANDIQFFTMRIAKIDSQVQSKFITDPLLSNYKHFLETLFASAKYQLSEPEEKILNLKSQASHTNWAHMISQFLGTETREEKTLEELLGNLKSTDKVIRDKSAAHIHDILGKIAPIAEHELNSLLLNKKIDDELRGFQRPDSARHLSDDIDTNVVDSLVSVVTSNFSIPQRFYELKSQLLGLPKLAYHERVIPYGQLPNEYTFKSAVDLVSQVFSRLDPQISQIFSSFCNSGTFDIYPKPGKRGGAFCTVDLQTKPTYILLNFTGKLEDVLTLAHECGHGINNELMRSSQNSLNFGTPLSTAEVASTFFEDFVLSALGNDLDDEKKLSLLIKKLDDDIGTIFRQIAFYNFETELHTAFRSVGYLSTEQIGELFQKHTRAYMGNFVNQDPGSENWWVYVSHFRSFFYVYSYASGQLISKSLQNSTKQDPTLINKVKKFLQSGTSQSPKSLFEELDIDISTPQFWEKGIAEISHQLDEALALAKHLKKI